MLSSFLLGGTTLNGAILEGSYFVGERGNFTEVSWLTYHVSLYIGVGTFKAVFAVIFLGFLIAWLKKRLDQGP